MGILKDDKGFWKTKFEIERLVSSVMSENEALKEELKQMKEFVNLSCKTCHSCECKKCDVKTHSEWGLTKKKR